MGGHDFELEKARFLSLALECGFDEESAKKCLDRLISLYGKSTLHVLIAFGMGIDKPDALLPRIWKTRQKESSRCMHYSILEEGFRWDLYMLRSGQKYKRESSRIAMAQAQNMQTYCELKVEFYVNASEGLLTKSPQIWF